MTYCMLLPTKSSGKPLLIAATFFLLFLSAHFAEAANPLDTWHQRACPLPNAALTSIAYGNGRFVVNADSLNRVLTSTNGIDWEMHPAPYPNLRAVTFGNGVFLAWFIAPQASLRQRKILHRG